MLESVVRCALCGAFGVYEKMSHASFLWPGDLPSKDEVSVHVGVCPAGTAGAD